MIAAGRYRNGCTPHNALGVLLGVLLGCDVAQVDPVPVVRDSAGVVIVENDYRRPAWTEATAWRLSGEPRVRIGVVSGALEDQLHNVRHAMRLDDGRIAVITSSEVRIYDGEGEYLATVGGVGEGPGEFMGPWKLHEVEPDSLLVIELYREISVFTPEGQFARQFFPERPDGELFSEGFEPVDQFGDGSLLFRSHHPENPGTSGLRRNRIQMVRVHLDGSFAGSLGEFDDQTSMSGVSLYLFGARAREAAGDSTMWYGPGDRFEMREIDWEGNTIRLIRLDRPAKPVAESDIAAYQGAMMRMIEGSGREESYRRLFEEAQAAPEFPLHYELETDSEGNLWVQDYESPAIPVERRWTVIDRSGRFLGDVVVPAGVSVYEIGADYLLGHWVDDLDVEYVVLYTLEKPVGA